MLSAGGDVCIAKLLAFRARKFFIATKATGTKRPRTELYLSQKVSNAAIFDGFFKFRLPRD
ncbi:MAG: hypothetical protein DMF07_10910 [Verrucomicrobia bacterium]|nr:MAG: hypothetical protein DMF07_10910 [Verrucomicrobiota bacterium]